MGLTVNRQTVKKLTVNRQKCIILTVNRQLNQAKLAVKSLEYLLSRTIIASNNGVNSCTGIIPINTVATVASPNTVMQLLSITTMPNIFTVNVK